MKRTTICRSSLVAAASLGLGLAAGPVLAQDPVLQRPGIIIVERGHTLWSLAEQYLGDPLLWPAIYRLNTDVIEDPHWIYPGEELRLGPMPAPVVIEEPVDTGVVVLPPEPPAPIEPDTVMLDTAMVDTLMPVEVEPEPIDTAIVEPEPEAVRPPPVGDTPNVFTFREERIRRVAQVLERYSQQPYRPLRRGEFYSAGFLTEGEDLPFGQVLGNVARPAIRSLSTRSSAYPFSRIAVVPPSDASYQLGDALWILRIGREVVDYGRVIIPAGIATVTSVQEDRVIAVVDDNFARITDGLVALPLERFHDPGEVRAVPVEQGLEGSIIVARDANPLTTLQTVVFIDRGRADGLTPGDVFEVVRPAAGLEAIFEGPTEEVLAVMMIVHTRENSATGLVLTVAHPDVKPGMLVRLIRKMPA